MIYIASSRDSAFPALLAESHDQQTKPEMLRATRHSRSPALFSRISPSQLKFRGSRQRPARPFCIALHLHFLSIYHECRKGLSLPFPRVNTVLNLERAEEDYSILNFCTLVCINNATLLNIGTYLRPVNSFLEVVRFETQKKNLCPSFLVLTWSPVLFFTYPHLSFFYVFPTVFAKNFMFNVAR